MTLEVDAIEARMRARRKGWAVRGESTMNHSDEPRPDRRGSDAARSEAAMAFDPHMDRGDSGFPRSATLQWVGRHPVSALSIALPVVALLAWSRPARSLLPSVLRAARSPAASVVAAALLAAADARSDSKSNARRLSDP